MDYRTIAVTDRDVRAQLQMHDLRDPKGVHDNIKASACSCRHPRNGAEPNHAVYVSPDLKTVLDPVADAPRRFSQDTGNSCHVCGNTTRQAGSCRTCDSCGTTSGCG